MVPPVEPAVPIVFGVDVEPDIRPTTATDPLGLDGFAACIEWLEELRPRFEDVTGRPVDYSWFVRMDPQMAVLGGRADSLAVGAFPDLERLRRRGDTIGLHTHAGRWDTQRNEWIVDHGNPEWVAHCVRTAFDAYAEVFGEQCRAHRFGDRWESPAALDLLASLGTVVDLTREPGKPRTQRVDLSVRATGEVPSSLHLRSVPTRHRTSPMWTLPLTAGDPGMALPMPIRIARRIRSAGRTLRRPLTIYRSYRSPDAYWDVVERVVDEQPVPYVALVVRSDLPLSPQINYARPIMDALVRRPFARRLRFTGPLDVVANLSARPAGAVR
jgi:hypothetical protein